MFMRKASAEILFSVLGVNVDLLEVLFLSRLIMGSWDEVAQETRTRLEKGTETEWHNWRQDGRARSEQECGKWVNPACLKLPGFPPSQKQGYTCGVWPMLSITCPSP